MDFDNKPVISSVHLVELQNNPLSSHFTADILLIDKSHVTLNPLLYQVNKELCDLIEESAQWDEKAIFYLLKDGLNLIGEITSLDKKKKLIYLKDDRSVAYRYLIIASGLKSGFSPSLHDGNLLSGLLALKEALKIRKNFPSSLPGRILSQKSLKLLQLHLPNASAVKSSKENSFLSFFFSFTIPHAHLSDTKEKVYEVQI